jgi:class 3 adenylate cyclase
LGTDIDRETLLVATVIHSVERRDGAAAALIGDASVMMFDRLPETGNYTALAST